MERASCALVRSVTAAIAVALLLAQSVPAGTRAPSVQVTPAAGGPGTNFVVSFTAPVRTGVTGSVRLRDELTATSVSGGKGCLARISTPVPDARRGQRVHVRLAPRTLGGNWCPGRYRGRVLEVQTAVCPRGTMCPTYVRLVGTVVRFSLTVRPAGPAGADLTAPTFAGITRAFACTPGPQQPDQTTRYTLGWEAASDAVTPAAGIVYDIYFAGAPGGEDFTQPTWTTPPGAVSFRTPGLPAHGDAYFVVRARDAAGNEDGNTREQKGIDPCV